MNGYYDNEQTPLDLFFGKGGSGVTTVATAWAISRTNEEERVLLASIGRVGALNDLIGAKVQFIPGKVAQPQWAATDLDILQIDSKALLEARYADIAPLLAIEEGKDLGLSPGALQPVEINGLVGLEDLLALNEIGEQLGDGEWDRVVVDLGSSAEALRLLEAADQFLGYLERIWPRAARGTAGGSDLKRTFIIAGVERVINAIESARNLLLDGSRTTGYLVTGPERAGVNELRRTRSRATLVGLRIGGAVVNRASSVPSHLVEALSGIPTVCLPATSDEPIGVSALSELARELEDFEATPASPLVTFQLTSGSGSDATYMLKVGIRLADASTLKLGRVGDELILSADGTRKRIALAAMLRPLVIQSANLTSDGLELAFAPAVTA